MGNLGGLRALFMLPAVLVAPLALSTGSSASAPPDVIKAELSVLAEHCCSGHEDLLVYLEQVADLPWQLMPTDQAEATYGQDGSFSHYLLDRWVSDEYSESASYYALAQDVSADHRRAQINLFYQALANLDASQVTLDDEVTALAGHLKLLSDGKFDLDLAQRVEILESRMSRLDEARSLELLHRLFSLDEIPYVTARSSKILQLQVRGGAL